MDLSDLTGAGPVAVERMTEAGVTSIDALANANVGDLTPTGMSESKAEKLIKRAKKQGVIIQTGTQAYEEYEQKERITTGMDLVDSILDGGWGRGDIVAVSGESGSGKTQLAFHALVCAAEQTGKPAVYIETERNRFSPKRIRQIATEDDTLDRIHKLSAYDLDQQELAYQKVCDHYDEVSLVVVDSFTANFRLSDEFDGRGSLSARSEAIGRHLRGLGAIADTLDAPVLITAQVYGNPSQYGSATATYGGSLFHHTVNFFFRLRNGQGSLSQAEITHHPEIPNTEFHVTINDDGLEAMKDT